MNDSYQNMKAFLDSTRNIQEFKIPYIPSFAPCHKYMQTQLEKLGTDHPEWKAAIFSLVSYPIQVWAEEGRSKIGIGDDNFRYILSDINSSDTYFGIKNASWIEGQHDLISLTGNILQIFSDYFSSNSTSAKFLSRVHSSDKRAEAISPYLLKKNYVSSVIDVCEKCSSKINEYAVPLNRLMENMNVDMKSVYHDAEILLQTVSFITKSKKEYLNLDISGTILTLAQCIMYLDSYPFTTYLLTDILKYKVAGLTQNEISKITGESQAYISRKYNTALRVLSILIWGFPSNEILILMDKG